MKQLVLLATISSTLLLAGCFHAQPASDEQPTPDQNQETEQTEQPEVVTGTSREQPYPAQHPDLVGRLNNCYEQTDPNSSARETCTTEARADFTDSKTVACERSDGFHNRLLSVTWSAGNAQSPTYYKEGDTLYYPLEVSTADTISCEQEDFELYLYSYSCTGEESTQLAFLNDLIEEPLNRCALRVIGHSDDALLAQLFPYERHGPWLDNWVIFDSDDGNAQAVNIRGDSSYSELGVVSEEPFMGLQQFTGLVKEHTDPYYSPEDNPFPETGTGLMSRGRVEIDQVDENLEGTLRHVYQADMQGPGPYRFIVTEQPIDLLNRSIGN